MEDGVKGISVNGEDGERLLSTPFAVSYTFTDKGNFDNTSPSCKAFVTGRTCWDRQVTSEAIEALYSNPHKLLQIEKKFSHLHD